MITNLFMKLPELFGENIYKIICCIQLHLKVSDVVLFSFSFVHCQRHTTQVREPIQITRLE